MAGADLVSLLSTQNRCLDDEWPDPFLPSNGLTGFQPFQFISKHTLLKGLQPTIGEKPDQPTLDAAQELFTFDNEEIKLLCDQHMNKTLGADIPLDIPLRTDPSPLMSYQLEFYQQNKNVPSEPAHLVTLKPGGPTVPIESDIKVLPTSVIAPVQKCIGLDLPATQPGTSLQRPGTRMLTPYSNARNLRIALAPSLNVPELEDDSEESLLHKMEVQEAFLQKITYRNLLVEKEGFKSMDLTNYKRTILHHHMDPPNNHTHVLYYDPWDNVECQLALRFLIKQAVMQGNGYEAQLGVHFGLVKLRAFKSMKRAKEKAELMDTFIPINGRDCRNGAMYRKEDQMSFVEQILDEKQRQLWQQGEFPINKTDDLSRDENGRKQLDQVINVFKCDIECYRNLHYPSLDGKSKENQPYVAVIALSTIGAPPILLQVGHLTQKQFPGELTFILKSPLVKKMVIGRGEMARALYSTFNLPWDHEHGVIDVQNINRESPLKPYGEGLLEVTDFDKLIAFQYWGSGSETVETRMKRSALANYAVKPTDGLSTEVRNQLAHCARASHEAWIWTACNNTDALTFRHSYRSEEPVIRSELQSANYPRRHHYMPEQKFCGLFNRSDPHGSPPPFDLDSERTIMENASTPQDKTWYQCLDKRFLQSQEAGLLRVAVNFYKDNNEHNALLDAGKEGGLFGCHAHIYRSTEYSVGIKDQNVQVFSEYMEPDRKDGADSLLSCPHAIAFNMAHHRRGEIEHGLPQNEIFLMDALYLANMTKKLLTAPGSWKSDQAPTDPGETVATRTRRYNRYQSLRYYIQKARRYRYQMIKHPQQYRPTLSQVRGKRKMGTWMFKMLDSTLQRDSEQYRQSIESLPQMKNDWLVVEGALPAHFGGVVQYRTEQGQVTEENSTPYLGECVRYLQDLGIDPAAVQELPPELNRDFNITNVVQGCFGDYEDELDLLSGDENMSDPPSPNFPSQITSESSNEQQSNESVVEIPAPPESTPDQMTIRTSSSGTPSKLYIDEPESEVNELLEPTTTLVDKPPPPPPKPAISGPKFRPSTSTRVTRAERRGYVRSQLTPQEGPIMPPNVVPTTLPIWHFEAFERHLAALPDDKSLTDKEAEERLNTLKQNPKWDAYLLEDDRPIVRDHCYQYMFGKLSLADWKAVLTRALDRYKESARILGNVTLTQKINQLIADKSFYQIVPTTLAPDEPTVRRLPVTTVSMIAPTTSVVQGPHLSTSGPHAKSLGFGMFQVPTTKSSNLPGVPVTGRGAPVPTPPINFPSNSSQLPLMTRVVRRAAAMKTEFPIPTPPVHAACQVPNAKKDPLAAIQIMASGIELAPDDLSANPFIDMIKEMLGTDYLPLPTRVPVSISFIRSCLNGYTPTMYQFLGSTTLLEALIYWEYRVILPNEEESMRTFMSAIGPKTMAYWKMVCGGNYSEAQVREIARLVLILIKLGRRQCEINGNNTRQRTAMPDYLQFHTAMQPIPLNASEKMAIDTMITPNASQYVIQRPEFRGVPNSQIPHIPIDRIGSTLDRQSNGMLKVNHRTKENVSNRTLQADNVKYLKIRKSPLDTAKVQRMKKELESAISQYMAQHRNQYPPVPKLTASGRQKPTNEDLLKMAPAPVTTLAAPAAPDIMIITHDTRPQHRGPRISPPRPSISRISPQSRRSRDGSRSRDRRLSLPSHPPRMDRHRERSPPSRGSRQSPKRSSRRDERDHRSTGQIRRSPRKRAQSTRARPESEHKRLKSTVTIVESSTDTSNGSSRQQLFGPQVPIRSSPTTRTKRMTSSARSTQKSTTEEGELADDESEIVGSSTEEEQRRRNVNKNIQSIRKSMDRNGVLLDIAKRFLWKPRRSYDQRDGKDFREYINDARQYIFSIAYDHYLHKMKRDNKQPRFNPAHDFHQYANLSGTPQINRFTTLAKAAFQAAWKEFENSRAQSQVGIPAYRRPEYHSSSDEDHDNRPSTSGRQSSAQTIELDSNGPTLEDAEQEILNTSSTNFLEDEDEKPKTPRFDEEDADQETAELEKRGK